MGEELRTNKDEIDKLSQQIISNSKDQKWAKEMIQELLRLQKQDDDMNKEIDVPISEVLETVSFGATEASKTVRGYLFKTTYHPGLWTFIGSNYGNACSMLQWAMDCQQALNDNKKFKGCEGFIESVEVVFQAPLFAAMGWSLPMIGKKIDLTSLLNISNDIKKEAQRFDDEHGNPAEPRQETSEDIADNIEFENTGRALETLANAPLPPEDTD